MTLLNPCPFCHSDILPKAWPYYGFVRVVCMNSKCSVEASPRLTEAEAVAWWNAHTEKLESKPNDNA